MNSATLSADQIEELRRFDTATVCNAIELFQVRPFNTGYMDQRIGCVFPKLPPMVGFAVTATSRSHAPAGDGEAYAWLQKHVEVLAAAAQPPVLVFQDLDSPTVAATFGEVMCTAYRAVGAAGLVTSGAGRDIAQVEPLAFPVFVGGINPSHAYCHFIDVNKAVHVGGITVRPGDLLHGDANGVTTIPPEIAPRLARACARMVEVEGEFLTAARAMSNAPAAEVKAELDKFYQAAARLKKEFIGMS